jgi:DNA processing protein
MSPTTRRAILNSWDDILLARRTMTDAKNGDSKGPSTKTGRRAYRPPPPESVKLLTARELLHGVRPLAAQSKQLDFAEIALNAPLWCAGDTSLVERKAVAIVGTRKVTPDGAARARRLARELGEAGIVVVSGLAKGVDTEALTSAIESDSKVIAVIGTPIDKAYPAENKTLQESIYAEHLLISQFKPGSRVFPSHFPLRNRLMALLTDASVIVEAGETSGTLHQAAECVRLGRWLFIARSVVDNSALKWPKTFTSYEKCRVLRQTTDILGAL